MITQRFESIVFAQDASDWANNSKERRRSTDHTKERRRKMFNVNNAKERRKMVDHTEERPAKGYAKKDDAEKGTWERYTTREKRAQKRLENYYHAKTRERKRPC